MPQMSSSKKGNHGRPRRSVSIRTFSSRSGLTWGVGWWGPSTYQKQYTGDKQSNAARYERDKFAYGSEVGFCELDFVTVREVPPPPPPAGGHLPRGP